MKTLKEILENNEPFTLSEYDNVVYNAMDHENHKTGINDKKEKVFTCIYSVYAINLKENICFTQAYNVWGLILEETHNLSDLTVYSK